VAAIPVTSLLAFVWLHIDASPPERIAELSTQIFWLVLPSLVLFLLLPMLLRHGLGFWTSLGLSMAATAGCYLALLPVLRRLGVELQPATPGSSMLHRAWMITPGRPAIASPEG
jgi:hypothetical protein